jgi:hypothetical protein
LQAQHSCLPHRERVKQAEGLMEKQSSGQHLNGSGYRTWDSVLDRHIISVFKRSRKITFFNVGLLIDSSPPKITVQGRVKHKQPTWHPVVHTLYKN